MPRLDHIQQGTPEWLQARVKKITASIAGAVLGVDKHQGPFWAFQEIMGRHAKEPNRAMQYGKTHEKDARNWYECVTGDFVESGGFWVAQTIPWLAASPDGLVGDRGIAEFKCPSKLPVSIPPHHEIQCRIQLAVLDRDWCDYLAWVDATEGPITHFFAHVVRDLTIEMDLIARLAEFYHSHIVPDIAPPRRRQKEAKT